MAVAGTELAQYKDQKVVVVYTPKGSDKAVEVEGTAEGASPMGLALKPRGRQNLELIETEQIEEVRFAPEKIKELKSQDLTPVKYGAARKHLADRHGGKLDKINKLSEEAALQAHAETDHSNLGHDHKEKVESAAMETADEPVAVPA